MERAPNTHAIHALESFFYTSMGVYAFESQCEMLAELGYDGITVSAPGQRWPEVGSDGLRDQLQGTHGNRGQAPARHRAGSLVPADQSLIWRFAGVEKGMTLNRYWSSNCKGCPLTDKCTPSQQRRVTRWEHQDVLDDMQTRLEQSADAMRIRRCSVEHPFGTIKSWMGATNFLTKGLERVKTEMSLHVLAYNFKHLITLLGVAGMMEAVRAYALILALRRAFGALALPGRPPSRKNRNSSRVASSIGNTAAVGLQFGRVQLYLSFYTAWAKSSLSSWSGNTHF